MMKRIFASVLALLMVLSMAACATPEDNTPPTESGIAYAQQNYALDEVADRLKLLGRSGAGKMGIDCDHTASGIEFDAYIQGEFSFTASCSKDTYFTVFVDGKRLEQRFEAKGDFQDRKIVVGDLGEMALRNIRILKQTEAKNSVATLKSMEFYGFLATAPKEKDLYIEFIGDSRLRQSVDQGISGSQQSIRHCSVSGRHPGLCVPHSRTFACRYFRC